MSQCIQKARLAHLDFCMNSVPLWRSQIRQHWLWPFTWPDQHKTILLFACHCSDSDVGAGHSGWHADTLPMLIVLPAVIGALNVAVNDFAERQGASAVCTGVFDTCWLPLLISEHHPWLSKQFKGHWFVVFQLTGKCNWVPKPL